MNATTQPKPTLDQRRARHAWQAVHDTKQHIGCHQKQDEKKFGVNARKLPVRIMASGLGQALAFLKAKDSAPGLLIEIADWVLDKRANPDSNREKPKDDALLQSVITSDSDFLRAATEEVLAYLQWLVRFAEAEGLTDSEGEQ
ncbi:MAG: type III-B CRISPR module-associated protein Cmr5 [Candidatus Anammoximicrobium sp.]|nr:type III-B CRISPR module-associated protein Cmr5 [Candidatus Anammoximicrobium sp.]